MNAKHRLLLLLGLLAVAVLATLASVEAHQPTVGLFLNGEGSFDGYTLFAPLRYGTTYLIDNEGRLVHSWDTGTGTSAYLLEDGSLIRASDLGLHPRFGAAGGSTEAVKQFAWDGTLVWEYLYSGADYVLHHDIAVLPNGNVLMLAWETKSAAEAIAAGRDPSLLMDGELWPEHIFEVEPTGASGGNIVWEWHVWDHLVQDVDTTKANYGVVADHPALIDVNYFDEIRPAGGEADWLHANALDYNEQLDQIVLSVRHFSEFWVIDHSTTSAEAAGHAGGDSGKGGDLLYRWGNPEAYQAGEANDQQLFMQHDAQWVDQGLPGAGNFLVFNNGNGRTGGNYSSVDEIASPVDAFGNYSLTPGQAYEPTATTWTYVAPNPADFYSAFISGAVRLPNGNTLICSGVFGTFFEVTPSGKIVWQYVNPVTGTGPLAQSDAIPLLGNVVFRAYRYAADYPGLADKDLTPAAPIEIADSAKDGLSNDAEINVHGTDPFDADSDDDSCTDYQEVGADVFHGGQRNPNNPWDYFNPTKDGLNRIDDILTVLNHYSVEVIDPPSYSTQYDRTYLGPNPWNLGPPNGQIRADDVLAAVGQYFHDCA